MDGSVAHFDREEAVRMIKTLEEMKQRIFSIHLGLDSELAKSTPDTAQISLPGSVEFEQPEIASCNNPSYNPRPVGVLDSPAPLSPSAKLKPLFPPDTCGQGPSGLSPQDFEAIKSLIRKEMATQVAQREPSLILHSGRVRRGSHDETRRGGSHSNHNKHFGDHGSPPGSPTNSSGYLRPLYEAPASPDAFEAASSLANSAAESAKKRHHENKVQKKSMEAIDDHTGHLFPTTAGGGTGHVGRTSSNDAVDDAEWMTPAENAYGAFVHVALQDGAGKAFYNCGPMLVASILIQFTFSYELLRALPDVEDAPFFCQIPSSLHLSAVGVFMTLMLNNVPGMFQAGGIALTSTEFRGEEGADSLPLQTSWLRRIVAFIFGVLTEMATWGAIVCSGVVFILTAESVDLAIRSTVAIIFVQNVDEIVFESYCSKDMKEAVRESRYRIRGIHEVLNVPKGKANTMEKIYSLFLHLPFVTLISVLIVYGLRSSPSVSCDSMYQDEWLKDL